MTLAETRRSMSGLDFFRKLVKGEVEPPPFLQLLNIRLVEVDEGRVVFAAETEERFYNGTGVAHGGFAATLLDSALGCAVASILPAGKAYTTAELKVNIVRPLSDKVPFVRAESRIIHGGGRMATSDARLTGPDGRLYAHGSTTCFIFDAP